MYFHFNMTCVQQHSKEMKVEDFSIGEDTHCSHAGSFVLKVKRHATDNSDQSEVLKALSAFYISKYHVHLIAYIYI